jgi:hypothetical protein
MLRQWALYVKDSDQGGEPVMCSGSGLWFPMPHGQETNCVWAELVFRLYSTACRFLRFTVETDRDNLTGSGCEDALDHTERMANNGRVTRLLGLLTWWETVGVGYWPEHQTYLTALGLTDSYRAALKCTVRAYGFWNGGCLWIQKLVRFVETGSDRFGDDANHTGYSVGFKDDDFSNMTEQVAVVDHRPETAVSRLRQVESLDDLVVHPVDRPAFKAMALTRLDLVQEITDMMYTAYQLMTKVPEWLPLYGSSPATPLSVHPHALLNDMKSSRAAETVDFDQKQSQLFHEHTFHTHAQGEWLVCHNAVRSLLITAATETCDDPAVLSRRPRVRSAAWSELNHSAFLVWLSRLMTLSGEEGKGAACRRAAVMNGAIIPGAAQMDIQFSARSGLRTAPKSCTSCIKEYCRAQYTFLEEGLPPDKWLLPL